MTYLPKATCNKLICCKTGLKLGGFNSFCSNFAEQVARFTEMKWVEIPVNLHLTHLFVLTSLLDLTSWVSPIEGRGARDTKGACSSSYKNKTTKNIYQLKTTTTTTTTTECIQCESRKLQPRIWPPSPPKNKNQTKQSNESHSELYTCRKYISFLPLLFVW